jgi:hypothetical protein
MSQLLRQQDQSRHRFITVEGVEVRLHNDNAGLITVGFPNGANFNVATSQDVDGLVVFLCNEVASIYKKHPKSLTEVSDYYGLGKFQELGKKLAAMQGAAGRQSFWTNVYIRSYVD